MIWRLIRGFLILVGCIIGGLFLTTIITIIQLFYEYGDHWIAWAIGIVCALLGSWLLGWLTEDDDEECDEECCGVETDPGSTQGQS